MWKNSVLSLCLCCAFLMIGMGTLYAQEDASEQYIYDAGGRRNPFIAIILSDGRVRRFKTSNEFKLVVEGIMVGERGDSFAVVTGVIVRVGDLIGGYEVVGIDQRKVIFRKDGQLKEVQYKEEE